MSRSFLRFLPLLLAALALSGCYHQGQPSGPNVGGLAAAQTARKCLGVPYAYGGRSAKGLDCSGLAIYVYRQQGVKLPASSSAQAKVGRPVKKADLRPGDLVFFKTTVWGTVGHVGIYIGRGRFIHAPGTGRKVETAGLDEKYFRARYYGARRVI